MKIAVTSGKDFLCQKYCLCKDFVFLSVNQDTGEISRENHEAPPSEIPGIVADWLVKHKVDMMIGVEIATLTKDCFKVYGIKVISLDQNQDAEEEALKMLSS